MLVSDNEQKEILIQAVGFLLEENTDLKNKIRAYKTEIDELKRQCLKLKEIILAPKNT